RDDVLDSERHPRQMEDRHTARGDQQPDPALDVRKLQLPRSETGTKAPVRSLERSYPSSDRPRTDQYGFHPQPVRRKAPQLPRLERAFLPRGEASRAAGGGEGGL